MALPPFRIKPYAHPRLKFVVRSNLTGKWVRKFFHTKSDAQTYVQLKEVELLNQGKEGALFPSSLRLMAQRESERLSKHGRTISDAADFYIRHLEAVCRSIPLSAALQQLITNRSSSGASKRYCDDLRLRLTKFCEAFPSKTIAELTTSEIDSWLEGLGVAPTTRNTFRRDVRTLFSFAVTRKYCQENPATETRKAKEVDGDVKILTVEESARLLEAADSDMLPYFAIAAFAGLRRAEIERLDWKQIDLHRNFIEVKARQAKTATRRLVTVQPNLSAWLQPYRQSKGNVCPLNFRKRFDEVRAQAGLLTDWTENILRHSYGSYHLAEFNDAPALALQMGNSTEVIFKHYRELVKPNDAHRYWSIMPETRRAQKIVRFSSTSRSV